MGDLTGATEGAATRAPSAPTALTTSQTEGVVPLEAGVAGEVVAVEAAAEGVPTADTVVQEDMTAPLKVTLEATTITSQVHKIPIIRVEITALACLSTAVLISQAAMVRTTGNMKVRLNTPSPFLSKQVSNCT